MKAGQIEIDFIAEVVRIKKDIDEAKRLLNSFAAEAMSVSTLVSTTLGGMGFGVSIGSLIALGRELVEVRMRAEALQSTLDFASGGQSGRELEYLRKVTNGLGLEFQATASSYAKFQAAARGTAMEGEGARRVFEAISKASAVMGLSADETGGALMALTQMVSKGTVQAEELRGQLGERIPGAFQIAARAMGVTTGELGKLLEQGLVPASEFLPKFAAQLEKELGGAAESAANRTSAVMNRLTNAWLRAKEVMAEGITPGAVAGAGFTTTGLAELTAALTNARKEGAGFWEQMERGQFALMRLVGPATGTAESVELLGVQIKAAEAELKRLQEGMRASPGDIILAQYTREAEQLLGTLRAAKAAKDSLAGGDPRDQSQFTSRSASIQNWEAEQAKATQKLAEARNKALGVNDAYLKQVMELNALRQKGLITDNDYIDTVRRLTTEVYKTDKGAAQLAKTYHDMIAASRAHVAAMSAEAAGAGKLTEGERKLLELQTKIESGTIEYSQALYHALAAQYQMEAAEEKGLRTKQLVKEAMIDAAQLQTKLIDADRRINEQLEAQIAAEVERADTIRLTAAELRARETATLRAAAAELELRASIEGGNPVLEERARLMRTLAEKREIADAAQWVKDFSDAQVKASQEAAERSMQTWREGFSELSQALTNALMDGGKSGADYLVSYLRTVMGRAMQAQLVNGMMNATGGTGGSGGGGGGFGNLSTLGSAYNMASGWLGGGAAAGGSLGAVTGPQVYSSMAALEGITVSETAAAATATGAAGSTAAAAIPIIGWIIAGIMASQAAYKAGNTLDMLDDAKSEYGIGLWEEKNYKVLESLGFSEKWAQILSGAPLTARLFGHKASVSGFGIGSVLNGDFMQSSSAPFPFGANVMGGGADPGLQELSSDIVAKVGITAGMFGGGLTEGMRFGSMTDRDRDNEVAALLGFFGADNKLIAGTQTGTGAFAGNPGNASKIKAEDFEKWVAEQMPVILVQGLQQSHLDARFAEWFNAIGAAELDPEKAQHLLDTATAVARLTDAFSQASGVFTQFETLTVATFEKVAEASGGFDALSQQVQGYYAAYYSEQERQVDAVDAIAAALAEVNLTMPTTRDEFRAWVDAQDLTTESGRKAFAVLMNVAGAFDAVADRSDAMMQRLQDAIAQAAPKFMDQNELRRFEAGRIADTLRREAGLDFSVEQLLGASKQQIRDFWNSFVDLSDGASAAEIAVTNAASSLADLAGSADDLMAPLSRIQTSAQAAAGREALNEWRGMQANAALFNQQLQSGTLAGGLQSYVDEWWGGAANMPGPTINGLFNAWMMQTDLGARVNANGIARNMGQEGGINAESSNAREEFEKQQYDQLAKLIEALGKLGSSLDAWRNQWQLGELSNLDPLQQYELASDNLSAAFAAAQEGDMQAFADWQRLADAFLDESNTYFGGGTGAAADREAVFGMWEEMQALRASMESTAKQTIEAINRSGDKTSSAVKDGNELSKQIATQAKLNASRNVGIREPG